MVLKNIPVYRKPFSMNCGWKMLDTTDKYANTRLIRSVYVCVCIHVCVCVCVLQHSNFVHSFIITYLF